MNARSVAPFVLTLALAVPGCSGMGGRRPGTLASGEPGLVNPGAEAPAAVVEAPPPKQITFVDRHPLLYRPRDYYDSSGDNKIVKTAAATFIGIPAGFVGEMRQIVTGKPVAPPAY